MVRIRSIIIDLIGYGLDARRVEDIVDAQQFEVAIEGVGIAICFRIKGVAQLVTEYRVIGVRERHIVEVAADDNLCPTFINRTVDTLGLDGTTAVILYKAVDYAANLAASRSVGDIAVALDKLRIFRIYCCGVQMQVEHAHHAIANLDVGPQ